MDIVVFEHVSNELWSTATGVYHRLNNHYEGYGLEVPDVTVYLSDRTSLRSAGQHRKQLAEYIQYKQPYPWELYYVGYSPAPHLDCDTKRGDAKHDHLKLIFHAKSILERLTYG